MQNQIDEADEDALKALEDGLRLEINDLKSQIEENDLLHGIPSKGMSSLYIPKDPDHYRKLRRLTLQRTMNVSEEKPLKIQAEIMMQELQSCEKREYTSKSIPLLIHQYFLDTIQECVAAKHAHLLRYKRYCISTDIAESIYVEYKDRMEHIMQEYLDACSRAQRLSSTQEGCLNNSDLGLDEVTIDDMILYLRWLVCHLYSMKYITQITRIVQWLPTAHWKQIRNTIPADIEKLQEDAESPRQSMRPSRTTPDTVVSAEVSIPTPPPALVASLFVSTKPLRPTEFHSSLASAGGGLVTNEDTLKLPLHNNSFLDLKAHLMVWAHVYDIEMDINRISTSADEMELYSYVNRKFKTFFNHQDQMRTFRAFDAPETQHDKWGLESCNRAVLKPANWLKYVRLQPAQDLTVVRTISQLRAGGKIDEILKSADRFLTLSNYEKVQDALRHHALLVQHPPIVHTASVVAHRQGINISEIFKKIYSNPELYNPKYKKKADGTLEDNHDNYEFNQTMQMLGLDDTGDAKDDPSSVQGAFLSYLHLRHLKMRDLQRTCMSVLNYFRSIERTITINDQGLSLDGGIGERSPQNHRSGSMPGHQGGGSNIGAHGYLYNTPKEFRISETEFMQFSEIENHDDFYFHEDGRIHVRDQAGYWIMYDEAVNDFEELRNDLLLISTVFISKDKELRDASLIKRKKKQQNDIDFGDVDILHYAHREVDRFGVLYDIWINHTNFLEAKKQAMDILMEAYQNTLNRDERRMLAQEITNLAARQPRIDLECSYFVATYRLECAIMRLRCDIYRTVLNTQIERQREYLKMLGDDIQDFGLPLPVINKLPIAANADEAALKNIHLLEFHPSLSMISRITTSIDWSYKELLHIIRPRSIAQSIVLEKRMLEILQTEINSLEPLGTSYTHQIQRDLFAGYFIENPVLMTGLADEYLKVIDARNTRGDKKTRKLKLVEEFGRIYEVVTARSRLVDVAWESEVLAKVYQKQANDLGYDDFHLFMRPIQFEAAKKKDGAEIARPPIYISSVQEDDTLLDKYTPSCLSLAANEIDEVGIGRFSVKGRSQIIEILEGRGIDNFMLVLKVQIAHKNALVAAVTLCNASRPSLYVHKLGEDPEINSSDDSQNQGVSNKIETRSEISATTITNETSAGFSIPISSQAGPTPLALAEKNINEFATMDTHPEGFFSIQLEKTPSRDRAMNSYVKKFGTGSSRPTGPETEKVKRDLVNQYVSDLSERIQQGSLRAQIIAYFNSIIHLLHLVPEVAHKFFKFGEIFEKKNLTSDNKPNLDTDPRVLRPRARRILSEDGKQFYNLWFIPHFTEILFFMKATNLETGMPIEDTLVTQTLYKLARLVCSFHDCLQFMVGISRLGINTASVQTELKHKKTPEITNSSNIKKSENSKRNSTSDYSLDRTATSNICADSESNKLLNQLVVDGLEVNCKRDYDGGMMSQISTDLIEVENQIAALSQPTNLDQVVNLITKRRNINLLKFEYCIRNVLLETLLSCENINAYKAVSSNIHYPLNNITNTIKPACYSAKLSVPEPLEPIDKRSADIFPFRTLVNQHGPFTVMLDLQIDIQECIQTCLAGLSPVDRPIVHGEFVSLELTLQEVLTVGKVPEMSSGRKLDIAEYESIPILAKKFLKRDRLAIAAHSNAAQISSIDGHPNSPTAQNNHQSQDLSNLSIVTHSDLCYDLIKQFIVISKRLDILKYHWGTRKLGLETIETPHNFKTFCKLYKTEKLYPLIKSLCIQYMMPELAQQGPLADTDIFMAPKGIPEVVVRQRQLSKMIETIEISMISDLRKKIVRQIDLVIKERNREEGNLPLDLWKKPAIKEAISVKRPTIAEDFVSSLQIDDEMIDENANTVVFDRDHFNTCLQNLGISVIQAQRECYDSYAMYYENQLKHQHHILYSKEREIEDLKQQLQMKEMATTISVQFQLADQAHSLLLEVNALRARLNEMREDSGRQESQIREEIRQEYNSKVYNLFSVAFEQKNQIDVYREYLHDATLKRIQEVRTEAALKMSKVKEKSGAKISSDDELAERNLKLSRDLTKLQQENIHVRQMMSRMKSVFNWQHTFLRCDFEKQLYEISQRRDDYKRNVTRVQMKSEQKEALLTEELQRLKQYLTGTEKELSELRKTLDKEIKEKMDKKHASERKAATDKQLALVKQMHIDQLMLEITEKNSKLSTMGQVLSENIKTHRTVKDKSVRELTNIKKTLREEKRLKQNAFNKVDDLVGQVYEFEAAFALVKSSGAASTSGGKISQMSGGSDSINCNLAVSAKQRPLSTLHTTHKSRTNGLATPDSSVGLGSRSLQPISSRPRPVTYKDIMKQYPVPYTPDHFSEYRNDKVGSQALRKRIANQLMFNVEPETHEQLTAATNNTLE